MPDMDPSQAFRAFFALLKGQLPYKNRISLFPSRINSAHRKFADLFPYNTSEGTEELFSSNHFSCMNFMLFSSNHFCMNFTLKSQEMAVNVPDF